MSVRRKKRPVVMALTTSMGDIAFLLIIFFILATITKTGPDLESPEGTNLVPLKGTLTITMDVDGNCQLNNEDVPVEALEGMIKDELSKRESRLVVVKIDRRLPYERYEKVYVAVSSAGGELGPVGIEGQP